jgi:hypothetical protein
LIGANSPMRSSSQINTGKSASVYKSSPLERKTGNTECMVRRRIASEKWEWRVGLRECIRPLLE